MSFARLLFCLLPFGFCFSAFAVGEHASQRLSAQGQNIQKTYIPFNSLDDEHLNIAGTGAEEPQICREVGEFGVTFFLLQRASQNIPEANEYIEGIQIGIKELGHNPEKLNECRSLKNIADAATVTDEAIMEMADQIIEGAE